MTTFDKKCLLDNTLYFQTHKQPIMIEHTKTGSRNPSIPPLIDAIESAVQDIATAQCTTAFGSNRKKTSATIENGLSHVNAGFLRERLAPVSQYLSCVDAEGLLMLQRQQGGTGVSIGDGIKVEPIHNKIHPPLPPNYVQGDKQNRCVRYLHVAESPGRFSMGVFVFPPRAKIPLHDHPEMCVMSRVLYGELISKSYDILPNDYTCEKKTENMDVECCQSRTDSSNSSSGAWLSALISPLRQLSSSSRMSDETVPERGKRGVLRRSKVIRAPEVTSLYPLQGNMHEFTAGDQGAAILDVLLPPYDYDYDRDCTFYEELEPMNVVGRKKNKEDESCWLVPIPQPKEFRCVGGRYLDLGEEQ